MEIVHIIKELRAELQRIDTLIVALEGLHSGRRRGRPPKALLEFRDESDPPKKAAKKKAAKKKASKKKKKTAGKKAAPKTQS